LLHGVLAFGAGALLAAVALVLVPEGIHGRLAPFAAASFLAGALVFLAIDRAIETRGGQAANLLAMVMDFVPESIALRAAFATGGSAGPLLAILIALQNLPEGFNISTTWNTRAWPKANAWRSWPRWRF
jgi:ZIP family zinc transporter